MKATKKYWKDIAATLVICLGLCTIGYVLVTDSQPNGVVAAKAEQVPAIAPVKALVKKPAATPSATPTGDTVTYIAEGTGASVTYGLNQVSNNAAAPLNVVAPLKCNTDVCFYSVVAILDNNVGNVVVKIEINGKLIGKSVADESHPTAAIVVQKDSVTGEWIGVPS